VTGPNATAAAARQGRQALASALLSLQTAGIYDPSLDAAIEHTASASSALYYAESSSPTEEAAASYIHQAADSLQQAMGVVGKLRERYVVLDVASSSIASTLALLYPVLQHTLRQRRARMQAGSLSAAEAKELRTMASFPRAPSPTGRHRRPSGYDGGERRRHDTKRVFIEVEIGLTSESHIYTGLSLDVSTGGVFVATYEPSVPGTRVSIYFVLPDGFVVNADGVVRWTRVATDDAPPGMGVAFVNLSPEALAHIASFCASRPPLYFDD
jgi:uncharacterized protein (TIGR02266 family)